MVKSIYKRIPNKGVGFFVDAPNKSSALRSAKQINKEITEREGCKRRILRVTKISRYIAPGMRNPYFVSTSKFKCR